MHRRSPVEQLMYVVLRKNFKAYLTGTHQLRQLLSFSFN